MEQSASLFTKTDNKMQDVQYTGIHIYTSCYYNTIYLIPCISYLIPLLFSIPSFFEVKPSVAELYELQSSTLECPILQLLQLLPLQNGHKVSVSYV